MSDIYEALTMGAFPYPPDVTLEPESEPYWPDEFWDTLPTLDGLTLASTLVELDQQRRELKAQSDAVNNKMRMVKENLLKAFETHGVNSMKVDGATVYLSRQISAKVHGDRQQATVAIKGWQPGLVVESFNLNTVSALIREQMKEGEYDEVRDLVAGLPVDVAEALTISDYFDIRIRKA